MGTPGCERGEESSEPRAPRSGPAPPGSDAASRPPYLAARREARRDSPRILPPSPPRLYLWLCRPALPAVTRAARLPASARGLPRPPTEPQRAAKWSGTARRGRGARRGEPRRGPPPPEEPPVPSATGREGNPASVGNPGCAQPRPGFAFPRLRRGETEHEAGGVRGQVSSAHRALCHGSGAVLSTTLLGRTLASVQNLHRFVLALLNVQERVRGKAPVLGAVLAQYRRLLHAALTVSEADLKRKGQILPLISPEQQKWGCEGLILSSTVITVWSSEERAEQIGVLACWMAHRSTVNTVYCFLSNRDAVDILQPK